MNLIKQVFKFSLLVCLTSISVVLPFSCSKSHEISQTDNLVNAIWLYAQENPYGFTYNIATLQPVVKGISVAYIQTQNSFGKQDLPKVINHALEHEKIVGGWLNDNNGQYYFDSVKVFDNSQMQQAIEFAKQNKQYSIYDLTNDKEIVIDYN